MIILGMILVITTKEKATPTSSAKIVVSHGVNAETGEIIILPCVRPEEIDAKFDSELGEYVL